MKIILLIFLSITSFGFSSEIEDKFTWKERESLIDFIGCFKAKDKIIAYGTNASFVYSIDNGVSWKQNKIEGIDVIIKLEFVDNQILGFSLDGHSLRSIDNGLSWQVGQIENIDSVYSAILDSGYFFVRDKNSINVIDLNFKVISTYKDDILWTQLGKYDIDQPGHKITIKDNNLFFDSKSNSLISINKSDFIKNKLTINQTSICDSCKNGIRIINCEDNLYLSIYMNTPSNYKTNLYYQYSISSNTFKEIVNSDYYKYYGTYLNKDSNTYQIRNISGKYGMNFFQFQFNKFNKTKNDFEEVSVSQLIPLSLPIMRDLSKINTNTFIAVSDSKTILKSTDLGQTWEILSCVDRNNILSTLNVFSDTLELVRSNVGHCYISKNNGITYNPNIYNYFDPEFKSVATTGMTYISDDNKIICINGNKSMGGNNVIITKDLFKNYEAKSVEQLQYPLINHCY